MPTDILILCAALLLIGLIWRLSSREITTSKERSGISERSIEKQRDSLEQRIAERTLALKQSEQLRIDELERIAQFGKLSEGLFHDLMSPLSSVSLYMERLSEGHADAKEAQEVVEKAVSASRRMRSFMDNVKKCLGNSSDGIQSGKADIIEEIKSARDVLVYTARMSHTRIEIIAESEPILIPAHPVRVHQVFLNLLANAVDACRERNERDGSHKERTISVMVERLESAVSISISDDGCGIAPEHLPDVFKKKFSTKEKGSGIGLMTVKSIVETELHGTIEVKSEQGRGATFTIKIPLDN